MQDKIILGMLSLKPMSIYDLKKNMEKSTSMFYNTSIGSIHPACQKLLAAGYITSHTESEGRRKKTVFTINTKGTDAYLEWLQSPLTIGKIKDELLVRIFFFADADAVERRSILTGYLEEIDQWKTALQKKKKETDSMQIPDEFRKKAYYQLATLDFGYEYFCFLEKWIRNFMQKDSKSNKMKQRNAKF